MRNRPGASGLGERIPLAEVRRINREAREREEANAKKPLYGWTAVVFTYELQGYGSVRGDVPPQPMADVRMWRTVSRVPPGKKKPVVYTQDAIRQCMDLEAWRVLAAVLVANGCEITESVREG